MKTKAVFVWLAALMLALGCNLAGARDGGSFGNGGGFHGNGGGFQGHQHFDNHRDGHMSGRFHDGRFHGGRFHDFHGRGLFIVGGPFFWDPYFYGAAVYPYNSELIYVPAGGADYSYYCRDPVGYYPDIQRCPSGWLQVAPDTAPD